MPTCVENIDSGTCFGTVKFIEDLPRDMWKEKGTRRTSLFECMLCGNSFTTSMSNVKNNITTSCGCYKAAQLLKANTTHGMSRTRQYKIWVHIKERCTDPKSSYYKDYGGRGITYCDKWKTFEGFWEDMCEGYSDNLEIDRIDVNKGYYKENCKWSSESDQAFRQRIRSTNTTGRTGVYRLKSGRYTAEIQINKKTKYLGRFDTFELACEFRELAEILVYGFSKE